MMNQHGLFVKPGLGAATKPLSRATRIGGYSPFVRMPTPGFMRMPLMPMQFVPRQYQTMRQTRPLWLPPKPQAAQVGGRVGGGLVPEGRRFRGLNLRKHKRGIRQFTFLVWHASAPVMVDNRQLRIKAQTPSLAKEQAVAALRQAHVANPSNITLTKRVSQGRQMTYLVWRPALPVMAGAGLGQLSVNAESMTAARTKASAAIANAGIVVDGAFTLSKMPIRGRFTFKVWYPDWKKVMMNDRQLTVDAENSNAAAKKVITVFKQANKIRAGDTTPMDFYMTSLAELDPNQPNRPNDGYQIPRRTRFYHYEGRFIDRPTVVSRKQKGRANKNYQVEGVAQVSAYDGERFSVPFSDEHQVKMAVNKVLDGSVSIRSIQRQSMLDSKPTQARIAFIKKRLGGQ